MSIRGDSRIVFALQWCQPGGQSWLHTAIGIAGYRRAALPGWQDRPTSAASSDSEFLDLVDHIQRHLDDPDQQDPKLRVRRLVLGHHCPLCLIAPTNAGAGPTGSPTRGARRVERASPWQPSYASPRGQKDRLASNKSAHPRTQRSRSVSKVTKCPWGSVEIHPFVSTFTVTACHRKVQAEEARRRTR